MKVEWNTVTWYSWVAAIIIFGGVYFIGMYVGMQVERVNLLNSSLSSLPTAVTPTPAAH